MPAFTTTTYQLGFGSGVFFVSRTDIPDATPYQLAALQDISISWNGELRDLFSQGQFPIGVARGKTKIEGKGKFALISTPVYNAMFFGQDISTGQTLTAFAEQHNIAATVVVTNATTYMFDLGVFLPSTGLRMTKVTGTPATGEYAVDESTGTYTFAAADIPGTGTKPVQISYEYTAATGYTLSGFNQFMGSTPTFRGDFYQPFGTFAINLTLYNCVATTMTMPTTVDNFIIQDFAFGAFAGADGSTFELSTTQ